MSTVGHTSGHVGDPVHPDSPMGLAGRVLGLEQRCAALEDAVRAVLAALGDEDEGSAAEALSAALKASQERAAAKRRALRETLAP